MKQIRIQRSLVVVLFSLLLPVLPAAPYVGVSQSITSTSLEVGFLTRSIDQNVLVSLPLLRALEGGQEAYRFPVATLNILYKEKLGSVLAIGIGSTLRIGGEFEQAVLFQVGALLQLSLEAPGVKDILFCELAWLPSKLLYRDGTPSSSLLETSIKEYIRFGYRRAF